MGAAVVADHPLTGLEAPPPNSVPTRLTKTRPRHHWARWALVIGIVVALAVGVQLWRVHSQNVIGYETVPVEPGPVQASVTATGILNQDDRHPTTAQVRYYDRDHRDFHYWDDPEDRAYRRYLVEQHRAYLKFERADISVHRHYWNWRHSHPDND